MAFPQIGEVLPVEFFKVYSWSVNFFHIPGIHLIIFSALNHDNFYSEIWTAQYYDHVKIYHDHGKNSEQN